ncbi:MAG: sarcosine oxidase subunit delta [Alphaproteobacteria bacterium]|jgi:heterotetrameric sarcosine oxidase delta subunit|nr:sarcosine oxidase subunit delta [Alphaproteobacteria bacterium]|tara:strand:- start:319 stop:588 length:270 start_codon:yes stop_codon:yes gene_type:complete
MLLIPCPHCGPRAQTEFSYGGDANAARPPAPEEADDGTWIDYLYLRDNPKGVHDELWQHIHGCRRWMRVRRDVVSHEITGCTELAESGP